MTEESLCDEMKKLAQFAADIALEDCRTNLDFSEDSLARVEEILANVFEQIPHKGRIISWAQLTTLVTTARPRLDVADSVAKTPMALFSLFGTRSARGLNPLAEFLKVLPQQSGLSPPDIPPTPTLTVTPGPCLDFIVTLV